MWRCVGVLASSIEVLIGVRVISVIYLILIYILILLVERAKEVVERAMEVVERVKDLFVTNFSIRATRYR